MSSSNRRHKEGHRPISKAYGKLHDAVGAQDRIIREKKAKYSSGKPTKDSGRST